MPKQRERDTKLTEEFSDLLVKHQESLYAFICTVLGRSTGDSWDILQETNLMLLKHRNEYDHECAFMPWARAFAYNQVRRFTKRLKRDRLIFDDDLLDKICAATEQLDSGKELMLDLLERCLRKLLPEQRKLIEERYYDNRSVTALAVAANRSASAVSVQIHRIRRMLADCIRKGLKAEGKIKPLPQEGHGPN